MILDDLTNKHIKTSDMITVQCDYCGKVFKRRWSRIKNRIEQPIYCGCSNGASSRKNGNENNPTLKFYWMKDGFTEEQANYIIRCLYKKDTFEYWWNAGYSEEECWKLREEYNKKKYPSFIEYWIEKGYSEDEAIKNVNEFTKKLSDSAKSSTYDRHNSSRYCIQYWINKGFSEEDAKNKVLDEQHYIHSIRDTEKMAMNEKLFWKTNPDIKKMMSEKSSKTMKAKDKSFSPIFKEYWMKQGYSEEDARREAKKVRCPKNEYNCSVSKVENNFFDEFCSFPGVNYIRNQYIKINDNLFSPDGRYNRDYIIEFNGTNTHLDSRFYTVNDLSFTGRSFEYTHNYDNMKYNCFIENGYSVYVVWEYDYKNHKDELFKLLKEDIENEGYKERKLWDSASFFNKC